MRMANLISNMAILPMASWLDHALSSATDERVSLRGTPLPASPWTNIGRTASDAYRRQRSRGDWEHRIGGAASSRAARLCEDFCEDRRGESDRKHEGSHGTGHDCWRRKGWETEI